ncbi:MAG: hypothetical protein ACOVPB_03065, partial [Bacteroidia bacterium]
MPAKQLLNNQKTAFMALFMLIVRHCGIKSVVAFKLEYELKTESLKCITIKIKKMTLIKFQNPKMKSFFET